MRIQDIIRQMVDMIDNVQSNDTQAPEVVVAHPTATIIPPELSSPLTHAADDINRFRQIVDLADSPAGTYSTEPNEKYADIDSVTINAGGGLNGPKHPHDIRVKDPSAYTFMQDAEVDAHQPQEPHVLMIKKLNGQ